MDTLESTALFGGGAVPGCTYHTTVSSKEDLTSRIGSQPEPKQSRRKMGLLVSRIYFVTEVQLKKTGPVPRRANLCYDL